MSRRFEVSDADWEKIKGLLPAREGYRGRPADNRLFVNAVMHIAKTGVAWRDLPPRFGKWNTVYVRFRRWALGAKGSLATGVFQGERQRTKSAAHRLHRRAGAPARRWGGKKSGGQQAQAIGRSRGGLTTKIHLATDERGRIRTLVFTAGQAADVSQTLNLVSDHRPQRLVADRAYDADYVLHFLDREGCEAVIPPKRSRKEQRLYDRAAYRGRNIIERTIHRLKECKKVATRYEKTTPSFAALCYLAATFINLRLDVNTP